MSLLGKLYNRSWKERWILLLAFLLLGATKAALALFPFRTVLRLVDRAGRPSRRVRGSDHLDRWTWALTVAGNRLLPGHPCLPQALVAHVVFRRAARPAELRIGARPDPSTGIAAHAWVESEGRVVIGDVGDQDAYVPFPPIPTSPRDG